MKRRDMIKRVFASIGALLALPFAVKPAPVKPAPLISRQELESWPVFVIADGDKVYRVFATGKVEGFDHPVFVGNTGAAIIATMEARHVERMNALERQR